MSHTVIVATDDRALETTLVALVPEIDGGEVAAVARSSLELLRTLDRRRGDVVLLDERLGPQPALDVVRETALRHPEAAVVVLVAPAAPAAALTALTLAGARAVLALGDELGPLREAVSAAAVLSAAVRRRLVDRSGSDGTRGSVLAVVGAKGGVGTTTLATALAMRARAGGARRVCLVDADLSGGDVSVLLDVTPSRTLADLAAVDADLAGRVVHELVVQHPERVDLLLAPAAGLLEADVPEATARNAIAALRGLYDVVVVDCGSAVTATAEAVVQIAERVCLVATQDVTAARGARRRVEEWRVTGRRSPSEVTLVVNGHRRSAELTAPTLARAAAVRAAAARVPAAGLALEAWTTGGRPPWDGRGRLGRAVRTLAREVGAEPVPPRRGLATRLPGRRPRVAADAGAGVIDLALTVAVLAAVVPATWIGLRPMAYEVMAQRMADRAAAAVVEREDPKAVCRSVSRDWGCRVDPTRVEVGPDRRVAAMRVRFDVPRPPGDPVRVVATSRVVP